MPTMPDPSAPTRPERVIAGRYEVGDLLGRGGMAEVFAGTDRRLGREVAVKLLLPAMAARPDIRSRFEAEARSAASLSHPNAVAVFDTGEHEGVPYIVMERLPGETLADRIAAGPVDPAWLSERAVEVLGALGAAHAAGMVHRDVKPGNILLAADGRAKVADFGIAKSAEAVGGGDLTSTGQLLGTPAYLAPERVDGAPADPRSDLWAVGVVLYEALTGRKPFSGTTALAIARAVSTGEHQPLSEARPDLDPTLVAAVERAMATDPAARFASAAAMTQALATPAARAGPQLHLADTVDSARADPTMVLGEQAAPARAGQASPHRPASGGPVLRRRALLGAAMVAALLVVFLVARAAVDDDPSENVATGPAAGSAPSTVPAEVTTTVAPTAWLAEKLRDAAAGLDSNDGPLVATLASRLRTVADQVEAGADAGGEATTALAVVAGLERAGQLPDDKARPIIELLSQVPGVNLAVLDALTPTTPTTAAPDGGGGGDGGGRGGGEDKKKEQDKKDD